MESELLQKTLETVITVLLPVLLAYAVAWLKVQTDKIKASISTEEWNFAVSLVDKLVIAAEQTGLKDELLKEGAAKKAWVLEQAQAALNAKNIKIDVAVLAAIVEDTVYNELNWKRNQ